MARKVLYNQILDTEQRQQEWRDSLIISMFKGKFKQITPKTFNTFFEENTSITYNLENVENS